MVNRPQSGAWFYTALVRCLMLLFVVAFLGCTNEVRPGEIDWSRFKFPEIEYGIPGPDLGLGQLLIVALPPASSARRGGLDPATIELLKAVQPGGVVLYAYNLGTLEQTRRMVDQIRALCVIEPFIAIDEEGGRVSRLKSSQTLPVTILPSARRMARAGIDGVYAAHQVMARELASLGVTMNFAPVLDLDFYPESIFLGDRSFGIDEGRVAEFGGAVLQALNEAGIVSVAKHFPGHGRTSEDTHEGMVVVEASSEELARDIVPFARLIQEGLPAIMTAHVVYPSLGTGEWPASLDQKIINGLARDTLEFDGLIITDSLNMAGAGAARAESELAIRAIRAGSDMILTPRSPSNLRRAFEEAIASDEDFGKRYEESLSRILRIKTRFGVQKGPDLAAARRNWYGPPGNEWHKAWVDAALRTD